LERMGVNFVYDGLERIGIDFAVAEKGRGPAVQGPGEMSVAFLNDLQVRKFLECVQGDKRTTVHAMPKVLVLNGQAATVKVGQAQPFVTGVSPVQAECGVVPCPKTESVTTGLELCLQPTVSADRRYVHLKVRSELTSLCGDGPLCPVTTMVTPVFEGGAQGKPVPFTQYVQRPCVNVQTMQKVVAVPDGGTVVIGGLKRTREVAGPQPMPVL